jgi:hypothetical protein
LLSEAYQRYGRDTLTRMAVRQCLA